MSRTHSGPVLCVDGAHKRYGDVSALAGVDLAVHRGEIVALLGPNGAGKTTLLGAVVALVELDTGTIAVDCEPGRRAVGYAGQEPAIYPSLTAAEHLHFVGQLQGLSGRALQRSIDVAVERCGIGPKLDERCGAMSGGWRRRVHLAGAFLAEPALVVVDEPTAGVDVPTRAQLLDAARALAASGSAVVWSTHYLEEVTQLGGRVVVLVGGTVRHDGTLAELTEGHTASWELRFAGPIPALSGDARPVGGGRVEICTHDPAVALAAVRPADRDRLVSMRATGRDVHDVYDAMCGPGQGTEAVA